MRIKRFIVIRLEQNPNTGFGKPVIVGSARDLSVAEEIRSMDMDDWVIRHPGAVPSCKYGQWRCQHNLTGTCWWYVEATDIAIDKETKAKIKAEVASSFQAYLKLI